MVGTPTLNADAITGTDTRGLLKKLLIDRAVKAHKVIYPIPTSKGDLEKCFTEFTGALIFWYDTADGSTHVQKERI